MFVCIHHPVSYMYMSSYMYICLYLCATYVYIHLNMQYVNVDHAYVDCILGFWGDSSKLNEGGG